MASIKKQTTTKTTKSSAVEHFEQSETIITSIKTRTQQSSTKTSSTSGAIEISTKDNHKMLTNEENVNNEEIKVKKEKKKKSLTKEIDGVVGVVEKEKKKKSKKSKKSSNDPEKENISVKSSFSKFDALQKKNSYVRTDSSKGEDKFNDQELENNCRSCGKVAFQMERINAEKNIWHKNCFRCSECSKQLNVDTYDSHDGILYCKPHFKALFTPKAVEDNEPVKPRKHEMIIRENQPVELPPDVCRSSDKPNLGLEELQSLNVKERFQVFENKNETQEQPRTTERIVGVQRSILSKLAKFQAKGSKTGVTDDQLSDENEDEEEEDDEEDEDADLIRAKKIQKERPMSFSNMSEVKTRFENGHAMTKEERREERKQEIQNIRSRLFMGKQAKNKELYEQAVLESEQGIASSNRKHDTEIGDKAKSIKERFEKGEAFIKKYEDDEIANQIRMNEEEQAVFEQGLSKKSRSIFLEMDAVQQTSPNSSPRTPDAQKNIQVSSLSNDKKKPFLNIEDVVKSEDTVDDVKIETAEISSKFKFFETFKPEQKKKREFRITPPRDGVVKVGSPEREVYRDPDVVRGDDNLDNPEIAEKSQTATKMLSKFRQMEEKKRQPQMDGLKPLKRFTPPPDEGRRIYNNESESDNVTDSESEDESESEESVDEQQQNQTRSSDKFEDEFLKQAQSAERAKQLRAKFEKWESNEIKREQNNSGVNLYDPSDESQVESTKSIRAKFESIRNSTGVNEKRDRIQVNRFV